MHDKILQKKVVANFFRKIRPYLVWGGFFTFFMLCVVAYSKLVDDKLKQFEFPYSKKEMKGDTIEFLKNIYGYVLDRNTKSIFILPSFFMVQVFVVFSFRVQLKRIREKLKKKSKPKYGNDFLGYSENIIIENKHTFLSKLIYFLNRVMYHLGFAVLILSYYRLILFFYNKYKEGVSVYFKNDLVGFFYQVGGSSSYFRNSKVPLISLTLVLFLIDFLSQKFLKNNLFIRSKQIRIINKKKLMSAISLAFLVITFSFFVGFLCEVFLNIKTKKGLELHKVILRAILDFNSILHWYTFVYFYTIPVLIILFYCFSSRLRDLRILIREIIAKLKRV